MIALSSPIFDTAGHIVSQKGFAVQQNTGRRAKRVATLDGGAVPVDAGYSSADLTFELTLTDPDGTRHRAINRMLQYHSTAVLSCTRGCFVVLLSNLSADTQGKVVRTTVQAEVLKEV